jgi:hypothetical protein
MNKKFRSLILFTLPALASCGGFSLDYIVEGNKYNSYIFTENYYEHWDSELKNAPHVMSFNKSDEKILKFTDIDQIDKNFLIDGNPYKDEGEYQGSQHYGYDHNLMKADSSFYYGVQSKLFDGEVHCDGYYQKHRVQTNQKGFSVRFQKESDELTYFAMQFKATTNNQIKCYRPNSTEVWDPETSSDGLLFHDSEIELTVTLYVKEEAKIVGYDFTSVIPFKNKETNDGNRYKFYAFDLTNLTKDDEEFTLSRLVGLSVTFEFTEFGDELIDWNEGKEIDGQPVPPIDYALFIYEIFLPYTYWH